MAQAKANLPFTARLIRAAKFRIARAQAAERMRSVRRSIAAGGALDGKVAVITGSGRGIGFAIAEEFGRAGAYCILVTLEREEGDGALDALTRSGIRADLILADVSDPAQVAAAASGIAGRHSRIDILVNNAGVFLEEDRGANAASLTSGIAMTTLAVNLLGTIEMSRALIPLVPRGGRIINVSSVMGREDHKADGYAAAYRLSKAALNSYTRSLAFDLKERGIMVDAFHPGWVKTVLGGPNAKIDAKDSTDTAFFLAMRPVSQATGLFWQDCRVMP